MTRRDWLSGAAGVAGGGRAQGAAKPLILVRSGWQTENIGDIAHTPGLLALIREHIPEARMAVWSFALNRGVDAMLKREFPELITVSERTPEPGGRLKVLFDEASMCLHGSGPSVVGWQQLDVWRKAARKPYGVFGVTVTAQSEAASGAPTSEQREVVSGASFIFTRETASLRNLRAMKLAGVETGFAPDATFALTVSNEARAGRFIQEAGLEPGRFICVIPRLRYTPYHTFRKTNLSPEEIARRDSTNARMRPLDGAKLRAVIIAWVRKAGGQALLCPEMEHELLELKPMLEDPLPEDVKRRVVRRRDYWITDEARPVFAKSAAVVSSECHSPIMAATVGVPFFYVRQPEDGIKGQMYADLGVGDWAPKIEETTPEALAGLVMKTLADPAKARARAKAAAAKAQHLEAQAMRAVRKALRLA